MGRLDVDEMLSEIPSTMLREWEYYAEQEPFGQLRTDVLVATLIQLVYNALRDKNSTPLTLDNILFPKIEEVSTPDEDVAWIESLVRAGKVVDMRQKRKR